MATQGKEITLEALQDMSSSVLEQQFAVLWTKLYPDIPLMTQVPFAPGRRFRADFAFGSNILFHRQKPKLLLPPGVLIDIHGGVHRLKFDKDEEKAIAARELGFKFHRLSQGMLKEVFLSDIARDIKELSQGKQLCE
jgi:hypothetical protein